MIKALQNSDHNEIADHVKLQLLINYSKVINVIAKCNPSEDVGLFRL